MKEQSVFKKRVYPLIFMFLITAFFIAIVSSIYLSTKDIVELNESLYLKEAVLYAAGLEIPETAEEIDEKYRKRIEEVSTSGGVDPEYFKIFDESGETITGYAIFVRGPGLWGEIQAIMAYNKGLDTILGIEFIKQNETPGLGARITEKWFKEQFRGKSGPFRLVPEGTADEPKELDAITGATRTSNFVLDIVNKAEEKVTSTVKG